MRTNLYALESLEVAHSHSAAQSQTVFNVREEQLDALKRQYAQVAEHPDDPHVRKELDELLSTEKEFWMPYARGEKGVDRALAQEYMKYLVLCECDNPAC